MKIERLPSGSYRIRQQSDGKRYTVILDHKPSVAEATRIMADKLASAPPKGKRNMTFADAAKEYLRVKNNVLSPSTLNGYVSLSRIVPTWFNELHIYDITPADVQRVVNDYAEGHSAKSVANLYGFISPVLALFVPTVNYSATLPQKRRKKPYIASESDVKRLLEYFKGTKYEISIRLAVYGLRRSEIIAVTADQLDGNMLTIDRAVVKAPGGTYAEKSTKTEDSTRTILIDNGLADLIRVQGRAYEGNPEMINRNLIKAENELGIEPFSLHKLRHFFASYCHNVLGLSEAQAKALGGWSAGSVVFRENYRHEMNMDAAKTALSEAVDGFNP